MDESHITYSQSDLNAMDAGFRRNFINSISGYKSVNLIGSIDKSGTTNLAIFNTIFHVGACPALIGMLIRPPKVSRHTLQNIRETGFYTINHVKQGFFNKAHQTAARYKDKKSEFEMVGLKPWFSKNIKAPYVHESPVKIGMELREEHEIKSNGTVLIVGEIIETIVLKNAILSDGFIDLGVTGTIAGSGLDTYYSTTKIARLSYAKPDQDLDVIG